MVQNSSIENYICSFSIYIKRGANDSKISAGRVVISILSALYFIMTPSSSLSN